MTDEQLHAYLASCRQELALKQDGFQKRIAGATTWSYAMKEESLTIGEQRFGMTPIGSFNPERQTWMWAWAHEGFPEPVRESARRLQGLHTLTGFRVFLEAGIPASEMDALAFTALAVHYLDAIGFFRCPGDGPVLHLAVHEPLHPPTDQQA